jgi:hypothetical protein
MKVPRELRIGRMNSSFQKVVSNRAVPGDSDKMFCAAFLEFSAAILLQVGTKSGKFGAEEMGGGLEGSQSGGRAVVYPEMRPGFKLS